MSTYKQIDPQTVLLRTVKSCDAYTTGINPRKIIGSILLASLKQIVPRQRYVSEDCFSIEAYEYNPDRLIVKGPLGYFECDLAPKEDN